MVAVKSRMHSCLAFLLMLCMIMSILPVSVLASDETPETYTITYKVYGEEEVYVTQEVTEGNAIEELPEAPDRDGKVFIRWFYINENGMTIETVEKGFVPSGNMTVYAEMADAYTITYMLPGEEEAYAIQRIQKTTSITTLPESPKLPGKSFVRWYYINEEKMTLDTVSESFVPTKDMVVYAELKAVTQHEITYMIPGEENFYAVQMINDGDPLEELPEDPDRDGKVLSRWFYVENSKVKTVTKDFIPEEDMTIYAELVDAYTLTFVIPGEDEPYAIEKVAVGKKLTDLPKVPEREGKAFIRWYYVKDELLKKTVEENFKPKEDMTIYAELVDAYTITFKVLGEEKVYKTLMVAEGNEIGELPEAPVREGKSFVRWFYVNVDSVTMATLTEDFVPTGDMTVYAEMSDAYEVTYRIPGESAAYAVQKVSRGESLKELPEDPDRDGKVFVRWFFVNETNAKRKTLTEDYVPTKNITVYAEFKEAYTIKYVIPGLDAVYKTQKVAVGDAIGNLPAITDYEGKTFINWYYLNDDGAKVIVTEKTVPTEDLTVYAELALFCQVTYIIPGIDDEYAVQFVKAGDTLEVTVEAPELEGKIFVHWFYVEKGVRVPVTNETVITKDTILCAEYRDIEKYTVEYFDGIDGAAFETQTYEVAEGSETPAFEGTPIRKGYTFMGWTPEVAVTVTENVVYVAMWEKNFADYKLPYTDVVEGSYYYDAVVWAVQNGIATGITDSEFGPSEECRRYEVVTFLWRIAGCPEPKTERSLFVDVEPGVWYEKAVIWAVENGITNGTGDGYFSPMGVCDRAQIMTFIWRYADCPETTYVSSPFKDVEADSWYEKAVLWAVEQGITNGTGLGHFTPHRICTRAEILTFLYRYVG